MIVDGSSTASNEHETFQQLRAAPADSYSDADPKPLAAYAALTGTFAAVATLAEVTRRRRGQDLPERISAGDLALLAVATYKLSRLATKARVTSFARAPFTPTPAKLDRPRSPRSPEVKVCDGPSASWPSARIAWASGSRQG